MKVLQGLSGTITSLTNIVIALLGLAIVVSLLGGNVPFVGGVADNIVALVQGLGDAKFGVAVALGAQDLFKNLISGILVLVEKRFKIGDWILVDGIIEGKKYFRKIIYYFHS